ncbi:MAG: hypothetical protein HBSAPP03_13990 [Phycisphaerae bacterium]|nr:MAG: hypothetical protein HBSAPP03_13990 [Phycisphaerae bacterium]
MLTVVVLVLGMTMAGDPPPLAGPRVDEAPAPARVTLIERDFDGAVKIPELPPEEVALSLLGLEAPGATAEQREAHAAARRVLEERAKFIDDFVVNNIPLLTMFGNAENTGDKLDQFMLGLEALRKFAPLREKGSLRSRLAAALPEAERARYETLLDEFWLALEKDRARRPKADGTKPNRLEILLGAKLESFGREGERSFARVQYSGELLYHYATRGLTLTPLQKRRLRELAADHAARGDNVTEADNRRLFARALGVLRVEQRPKFIRNLRGL